MKCAAVIVLLLALSGCAARTGTKVWWNPTTWGTDRAAAVQVAEQKLETNERSMIRAAQVEQLKTSEALAVAPASRPVEVARRTSGNAEALLAQANGAVTVGEATEAREIVTGLVSEDVAARAEAEKRQAAAEVEAADLAEWNAKLREKLADKTDALQAGYTRERQLANQVRNFWFVAIGLGALWLFGQVAGVTARVNPAFAGVSAFANGVLSPALSHAYNRAHTGLQKLGAGMDAVRKNLPEVADRVTGLLDAELDDDHKRIANPTGR